MFVISRDIAGFRSYWPGPVTNGWQVGWVIDWRTAHLFRSRQEAETIAFDWSVKNSELLHKVGIEEREVYVLVTNVGINWDESGLRPDPECKRLFYEEKMHQWNYGWEGATLYSAPQDAGYMIVEAQKNFTRLKGRIIVSRLDKVYKL